MYHECLPLNDRGDGLIKVIAFTCVILHWVLQSLQQGPEQGFDAKELMPVVISMTL